MLFGFKLKKLLTIFSKKIEKIWKNSKKLEKLKQKILGERLLRTDICAPYICAPDFWAPTFAHRHLRHELTKFSAYKQVRCANVSHPTVNFPKNFRAQIPQFGMGAETSRSSKMHSFFGKLWILFYMYFYLYFKSKYCFVLSYAFSRISYNS